MEQKPYKRKHTSGMPDFRAFLDYFMGGLMVFGGIFIIFSRYFIGQDYFEDSALVQGWMKWFLGIIFMLYGAFRLYRGYHIQQERRWQKERDNEA